MKPLPDIRGIIGACLTPFDDNGRVVCLIKLMQFDENDTARGTDPGGMTAADGIADIGADGIGLMFVSEFTLEHKKLLAAAVNMR